MWLYLALVWSSVEFCRSKKAAKFGRFFVWAPFFELASLISYVEINLFLNSQDKLFYNELESIMTFLEEAKTILSADDMEMLLTLSSKAATFETTTDEDITLGRLKSSVHTAINDRERVAQLSFLGDKKFTASEVLLAAGYTRKELLAAIAVVYTPETVDSGIVIATYPAGSLCENQRVTKELKKAVSDGGVVGLVANLTEAGRAFLVKTKVASKGPTAGKVSFASLSAFAKRTGLDSDALKAELDRTP